MKENWLVKKHFANPLLKLGVSVASFSFSRTLNLLILWDSAVSFPSRQLSSRQTPHIYWTLWSLYFSDLKCYYFLLWIRCSADQLTGFYMRRTLVVKGLMIRFNILTPLHSQRYGNNLSSTLYVAALHCLEKVEKTSPKVINNYTKTISKTFF